MEFRILGGLEARADGQQVSLGGPCEQKLLAVLLLDVDRVVPLSRIADALWDDDPPATAAKAARNAVSRLRSLLAEGGAPGIIVTSGAGYRLAVAAEAVDAHVFMTCVDDARQASSAGRLADAAEILRRGLALWRGQLLAGLTGSAIEAAATGWEQRRRAAEETFFDHLLTLGQHEEVVAELSALVSDDPLREKLAIQLMLALYRCGRQAEALQVYHDVRASLAERMGLDPSPEMQRMVQGILRRDPALDIPARKAGTRNEALEPVTHDQLTRAGPQPGRRSGLLPRPRLRRYLLIGTVTLAIMASGSAAVIMTTGGAGKPSAGLAPSWTTDKQNGGDIAEPSSPEPMDGDDPRARDCSPDAVTLQSVPMYLPGSTKRFGTLRLRHSRHCGTDWASAYYGNRNLYTIVLIAFRPADGAETRFSWSNNTPPGSYGNMLSTAPGCVWVEATVTTPWGTSRPARTGCQRLSPASRE